MNLGLDDIIKILDLKDIKNLTEESIRQSYLTMMKKYHPDKNKDMVEIATEISKVINEAREQAILKIDEIKISNTYNLESWAKLNRTQKKDLFSINNHETCELAKEFIIRLYNRNMGVADIIKLMNSMEYGLVTTKGIGIIYEEWGQQAVDTLSQILEIERTDSPEYYQKLGLFYHCIVGKLLEKVNTK